MPDEVLLHTFGIVEVILALWILSGWRIFWPSAAATLMLWASSFSTRPTFRSSSATSPLPRVSLRLLWYLGGMNSEPDLPEKLELSLSLAEVLRYGENPHQSGALYLNPSDKRAGVATARKVQGKELSFNNLQDADAAFECVAEFDEPAAVIVKHMNPCGGGGRRERLRGLPACARMR